MLAFSETIQKGLAVTGKKNSKERKLFHKQHRNFHLDKSWKGGTESRRGGLLCVVLIWHFVRFT